MSRYHQHDPNFLVSCSVDRCKYSTKSWNAFKLHISRKHESNFDNDQLEDDDATGLFIEEADRNIDTIVNAGKNGLMAANEYVAANFVLSLQADHSVSNRAVDQVIAKAKQLVTENLETYKEKCYLENPGLNINLPEIHYDLFTGLETQYQREKFYKTCCSYIEPKEVLLGERPMNTKSGVKHEKRYGYIIPFKESLKSLLEMPEIWHWVKHPHKKRQDGVMYDFCDGSFQEQLPLFQRNPSAIQIVLYTDEIELVNPIGAHVKKHKVTMFYYLLANIPPQFRSKLSGIYLVGMAKHLDMKYFGPGKLLSDFMSTVSNLSQGGIEMQIHGFNHNIEGNVIAIPADTPAANWLGGFKEGVSFAYKGCRTCDLTSEEMKHKFKLADMRLRDQEEHQERCSDLRSLSKTAKVFWSKKWGINKESCLSEIPMFPYISVLLHDPMHVLLEGLIPLELQLFLFHAIKVQKYFTLEWLNKELFKFPYTYLEASKPECIQKNDIIDSKLKQTSAAMLTLISILPIIIGEAIPDDDTKYQNLLRLFQISHMITSPCTSLDTVGKLEQTIYTHHIEFKREYPKAAVVPKMHYLLHIPRQMILFGPGRHQWCLRFEAKHAFFKSLKSKSFKNLLKTLSKKHQTWLCYQQLGINGGRSQNFVYKGDIVGKGYEMNFSYEYPELVESLRELYQGVYLADMTCYCSEQTEIHGLNYRRGCFVILDLHNGEPVFGQLEKIIVIDEDKFLLFECFEVDTFDSHILSYVLRSTGEKCVKSFRSLTYPWPRSAHIYKNQATVLNAFTSEFEYLG